MSPEAPIPETPMPLQPELKKDWRFCTGMAALILACVMPLFGLAVPLLGLPDAWSAGLVGVLVAGGPELLIVVAVALLGKQTVNCFFAAIKNKIVKAFSRKPTESKAVLTTDGNG